MTDKRYDLQQLIKILTPGLNALPLEDGDWFEFKVTLRRTPQGVLEVHRPTLTQMRTREMQHRRK